MKIAKGGGTYKVEGTAEGILTLRALKAEPVDELLGEAMWDEALMVGISGGALEQLLRYILNAGSNETLMRQGVPSAGNLSRSG